MARTIGATGITEAERRLIRLGAAQGKSLRQLAAELGRHHSAVHRIIKAHADDPQPVLPLTMGEGRDHA